MYNVQHNGKGKYHLLDENNDALCKTKAMILWTAHHKVKIENGIIFEVDVLTHPIIESYYCTKCIKKLKSL